MTGFDLVLFVLIIVLLGFTGFSWVLLVVTGFDWVLFVLINVLLGFPVTVLPFYCFLGYPDSFTDFT